MPGTLLRHYLITGGFEGQAGVSGACPVVCPDLVEGLYYGVVPGTGFDVFGGDG